jgi:hypothetical protein
MTDNTFAAPVGDGETGANRKMLLVGGAAAVAVLAGAGWFLLHGGSSSDNLALPVAHGAPVVAHHAQVTKATLKTKVATTKLPAVSSVKIGRDPFAALYVVPAAPAAGSGSTTTSTAPTTTTTIAPATSATDTSTNARYTVVLTKVATSPGGGKYFTWKIGTTYKTVIPNQRFGKYGELVVLTWVKNTKGAIIGAVLQVGDDNPIGVPIGVKTSVQ